MGVGGGGEVGYYVGEGWGVRYSDGTVGEE